MKKLLLIILLGLYCFVAEAQFSVKFGDFKYKISNYRGAAKSYRRYLRDEENQYNVEVLRKLAKAYQKSNQFEKAEETYSKLTILDSSFADVLEYSDVLMKNKKYDTLSKYINSNTELAGKADPRLNSVLSSVKNVNQLSTVDTANIKISKHQFNSLYSDFAPSYFQNGIIYSSNRISSGLFKSKRRKENKNLVGLYFSSIDDEFKSSKKIAKNLVLNGNVGIASYHAKSRSLYYVVNNKPKKSNSTDKDLNIYIANYNYVNNTWTKGKIFPYNSPVYSNTTPFVNAEGTRIYFSSNMSGGYGGFDLYYCDLKDSIWSKPQNMGPKINTAADEFYPFVDHTNLLYYSSNGKSGMGGFDIYTYDLMNPKSESDNLGAPFNSNADDYGLIKFPNQERGYFSSSRESIGMDADIYSYTRLKPTTKNVHIQVLNSKDKSIIPNAELFITYEQQTTSYLLNNGTKVIEKTEPGKNYKIIATASNYDSVNLEILVNRIDTLYSIELKQKVEGCSLQGIVKNKTSNEVLENVLIQIQNIENANENYLVRTDNRGRYKIVGLKKLSKYKILVTKEGYFNSEKNLKILNTCIPVNNTYDYIENFNLISGNVIKLENIHFDFNKVNIRMDAAKELDKIVAFMNETPDVMVELYAHTDSRGSDDINKIISEKRAKASVKYIISKGISKSRIVGKGFGETKLLNNCANDVECSEEQHQLNRRTEMKVVNIITQ